MCVCVCVLKQKMERKIHINGWENFNNMFTNAFWPVAEMFQDMNYENLRWNLYLVKIFYVILREIILILR